MTSEILNKIDDHINYEPLTINKFQRNNKNSSETSESQYLENNIKEKMNEHSNNLQTLSEKDLFFKQTKLMIWKNYIVFKRNPKQTFFQVFTPIFICSLLFFLQKILNHYNTSFINKNPEIQELKSIRKCIAPKDCLTIGYGIIGDPNDQRIKTIREVISYVSKEVGLELDKDVKQLTLGKASEYMKYIEKNINKTEYGILFCLTSFDYNGLEIPCEFEFYNTTFNLYTLLYNISSAPNGFLTGAALPLPIDEKLLKLKVALDNAYLNVFSKRKNMTFSPKIDVKYQAYPSTPNRFIENADIVSSSGPFYFFFPPIITFVVILLEIIREKDLKLRKSLLIIGLRSSAFWVSWFITGVIFAVIVSFTLVVFGLIFQFEFFTKTPFLITFSLFFLFNLTMQFLAYFLTTILKSMKSAYTATYGFILIGLVMEIFLSNYAIIYYLYSVELPWWVGLIKFIFSLYPPFNFSKAFSDISNKSANHFDTFEWRWVQGNGYTWGDLFTSIKGKMRFGVEYEVPSTFSTMGTFLLDIAVFSFLAWYFDHVDDSNRGKNYSKLFFLEKSYWISNRSDEAIISQEEIFKLKDSQSEINTMINQSRRGENSYNKLIDDKTFEAKTIRNDQKVEQENRGSYTVTLEKEKIYQSEEKNKSNAGLRVMGVAKEYIQTECCKKHVVKALKPVYLDINRGELFTILGHNGAGKTTLINILTGNISTSAGTAKINGYDILKHTGKMEEYIGLCPQHDILWEELTAREHILLYSKLRNIHEDLIPSVIDEKLKEVNLVPQADNEVRTFSGGMKRRLSILLSTIGNPRVLFLDEPTTGLDPINKRFIWSMIQNIKKQRAVILTTHSMEEADFLSDRIGVIVEGVFKCIGSPLELKNYYGSGYLLTFVCDHDHVEKVKELLKEIMPSSKFLDSSGGCIILNIPFDKVVEMKYFTEILNNNYKNEKLMPLKGLIKECGMNYTTLEEIFLKITSKKLNKS